MDPLTILSLAIGLYKLASNIRTDLMQRGEWTAEQEAKWQGEGEALFASPAWQPDP